MQWSQGWLVTGVVSTRDAGIILRTVFDRSEGCNNKKYNARFGWKAVRLLSGGNPGI